MRFFNVAQLPKLNLTNLNMKKKNKNIIIIYYFFNLITQI